MSSFLTDCVSTWCSLPFAIWSFWQFSFYYFSQETEHHKDTLAFSGLFLWWKDMTWLSRVIFLFSLSGAENGRYPPAKKQWCPFTFLLFRPALLLISHFTRKSLPSLRCRWLKVKDGVLGGRNTLLWCDYRQFAIFMQLLGGRMTCGWA